MLIDAVLQEIPCRFPVTRENQQGDGFAADCLLSHAVSAFSAAHSGASEKAAQFPGVTRRAAPGECALCARRVLQARLLSPAAPLPTCSSDHVTTRVRAGRTRCDRQLGDNSPARAPTAATGVRPSDQSPPRRITGGLIHRCPRQRGFSPAAILPTCSRIRQQLFRGIRRRARPSRIPPLGPEVAERVVGRYAGLESDRR